MSLSPAQIVLNLLKDSEMYNISLVNMGVEL